MAITSGSLVTDLHEYTENLTIKYRRLWDVMLDDDNGISEEVYGSLVLLGEIIDPKFVYQVSRFVGPTINGRFYIGYNR